MNNVPHKFFKVLGSLLICSLFFERIFSANIFTVIYVKICHLLISCFLLLLPIAYRTGEKVGLASPKREAGSAAIGEPAQKRRRSSSEDEDRPNDLGKGRPPVPPED